MSKTEKPTDYLGYPGMCARCGGRWGDHLTTLAIRRYHPQACRFYAKPEEIEQPTLNSNLPLAIQALPR